MKMEPLNSRIKSLNRLFLYPALLNLRADKLSRMLHHNTMLNIMYHGVVTHENDNYSNRHISKIQFEKHLQYFTKEFDVISLTEAFRFVQERIKPKRKTITISFDDGYKNNLEIVLPLLEKYQLKATFFVSGICTKDLKLKALWTDIIDCLKFFHQKEIIEVANLRFKDFCEVSLKISLFDFLKSCNASDRDKYVIQLVNSYELEKKLRNLPSELWELLNKNELRDLSTSELIEIGSHGYSHYNLANIDIDDAIKELRISKSVLENLIEKPVKSIAFPDGSYNKAVKNAASILGYERLLAVNYLLPDDREDTQLLNRHGISSKTTYEANILLLNYAFIQKGFRT